MRFVESLNHSLHEMMRDDKRVILLGEDILDPYGGAFKVSKGLSTAFPEQVLTTPVSEAGITGVATGLALRGFLPIVEIMFGDFLTLTADQVINGACKFPWMYNEQVTVPLTIRTAVGARRGYGPTHSQTMETLFLNTPQLTIIAPNHLIPPGPLLRSAVFDLPSPTLFVENKLLYPQEIAPPEPFTLTQQGAPFPTLHCSLDPNPQAHIIAYGGMAPIALEAALKLFLENEYAVDVIIPTQIKPLPPFPPMKKVLIVEEAPTAHGWGAEVAAQLAATQFYTLEAPIARLGADAHPIPASKSLETASLPQVESIFQFFT